MTEVKRSAIIGEIGLCELALQKYRDAAEHLAESLQQRAALSLNLQRRFEEGQRSAEARVVRLYLGVSPADAEVLLDGKPIGKQAASYELFLTPGQHTVRARLLGYGDAVNTFTAGAGDKRRLVLRLPRAPQVPTASAASAPAPIPPVPHVRASSIAIARLRVIGTITAGTTAVMAESRSAVPASSRGRSSTVAPSAGVRAGRGTLACSPTPRRSVRRCAMMSSEGMSCLASGSRPWQRAARSGWSLSRLTRLRTVSRPGMVA